MSSWKRTLALMVGAQFTASLGFSVIYPFLPFYVAQLGSISNLSIEMLSGLVYSSPSLTMAIASSFWGAVADRRGRKPMVLRAAFGAGVMFLLMGFVANTEQLIALRVLQGLVTGTLAASSALIVAVTPREHTGYAMGWFRVGLWSGNAAGPVLGGVLSDLTGYRVIFVVTAALLALSGLGVWLLLLLQAFSGIGVGGLLPSLSALLAQYLRLGEEGSVYGIESSVMSAARGIAPLLASGCALWFSLSGAFLLTAAVFAAVALFASLTVCRPSSTPIDRQRPA